MKNKLKKFLSYVIVKYIITIFNLIIGFAILFITFPFRSIFYLFKVKIDMLSWLDKYFPILV